MQYEERWTILYDKREVKAETTYQKGYGFSKEDIIKLKLFEFYGDRVHIWSSLAADLQPNAIYSMCTLTCSLDI